MPKFVATTQAYVDDCLISAGTEFECAYCPGDWAVPKEKYVVEQKAKENNEDDGSPMTLSEAVHGKRRGPKNQK